MFDNDLVLKQLRYTGMLETIKIRKAGYSVRIPFEVTYNVWQCLYMVYMYISSIMILLVVPD